MGVTVVRAPEYNPWREQLAANVLMPIVSDLWKDHRQREQYRKENAVLAKTYEDLLAQSQIPAPIAQTGGMPSTTGQSGNGWENAFDSPLAQFDANMTSIMPPSAQQVISANDFLGGLAANLGTKRFGMVDPKRIQELAVPYLNAMEASRLEGLRKGIADDYMNAMNASNAAGGRNALMNGAIQRLVSENLANMGQSQYLTDRPQNSVLNTGGQQKILRTNPVTGEVEEIRAFDNTLTPQQDLAGRQWQSQFDENTRAARSNEAYRDRQFDASRIEANRNYELQKRPKYVGMGRGDDGVNYMYFDDGSKQALTPDAVGLTPLETQQINSWEERRKALITQRTNLQTALSKAQTDEERTSIVQSIMGVDADIKAIDQNISSIYESKLKPQRKEATSILGDGTDIGSSMLGGSGSISSPFGKARTRADGSTYNHKGTDYAVAGGTEILVPEIGTNFTVTKVANDANGYGNYVDLESMLKGHKIELRIGHMKNGGVNVRKGDRLKAGELIGLVGNTGNSRGKNGGYHMHLEAKLDGKHVDPTTLWQTLQPYMQRADEMDNNVIPRQQSGQTQSNNQPTTTSGDVAVNPTQQKAEEEMQKIIAENNGNRGSGGMGFLPISPVTTSAIPPALPVYRDMGGANLPATIPNGSNVPATVPAETTLPLQGASLSPSPIPLDLIANSHKHLPQQEINRMRDGLRRQGIPENVIDEALGAQQYDAVSGAQLAPPLSSDVQASSNDAQAVLREAQQGMPEYDLSNAELTANLPGNGVVPRAAARIDPDGGLTQYRAEGDNSPVTWRNSNGQPMRTSDGQLFTQNVYDEWKQKADAGGFRNVGITNATDLDNWLKNVGMSPSRPSEERGINNLNGNSNANLPSESEDSNITPTDITPSNNPEKFPAPQFTDEINGTTPADTQDLLDGLNGITGDNRRMYGDMLRQSLWGNEQPQDYPLNSNNIQNSVLNIPPNPDPTRLTNKQWVDMWQAEEQRKSFNDWVEQERNIPRDPYAPENFTSLSAGAGSFNPSDYEMPEYDLSDAELLAGRRGGVRKGAKIVRRKAAPRKRVVPRKKAAPKRRGRRLKAPTSYEQQRSVVDGAAKRHGVDKDLIRAMIQNESTWDMKAVSDANAKGLMQLMPGTAREMGVRDPFDPAQNIEGGTKYIAKLIKRFGDVSKALMAYNCGPGNVRKGRIPKVSRAYARNVINTYRRLKGQR